MSKSARWQQSVRSVASTRRGACRCRTRTGARSAAGTPTSSASGPWSTAPRAAARARPASRRARSSRPGASGPAPPAGGHQGLRPGHRRRRRRDTDLCELVGRCPHRLGVPHAAPGPVVILKPPLGDSRDSAPLRMLRRVDADNPPCSPAGRGPSRFRRRPRGEERPGQLAPLPRTGTQGLDEGASSEFVASPALNSSHFPPPPRWEQ